MDPEGQRHDYFGALEWVAGLMRAATPGQMGAPTPCEEFTVRDLMGHLVGTARRSAGTVQGISTRHVPHVVTGIADGDLAATYESVTQGIRKLWPPASQRRRPRHSALGFVHRPGRAARVHHGDRHARMGPGCSHRPAARSTGPDRGPLSPVRFRAHP
jgi:Mycothiol maleylpyruvate isomerase N-terminal domain